MITAKEAAEIVGKRQAEADDWRRAIEAELLAIEKEIYRAATDGEWGISFPSLLRSGVCTALSEQGFQVTANAAQKQTHVSWG